MKGKPAPDWFGCGRNITQESWNGFLEARAAYYAKLEFSMPVQDWGVVAFHVPVIIHGPVRSLVAREPYRIPLPQIL